MAVFQMVISKGPRWLQPPFQIVRTLRFFNDDICVMWKLLKQPLSLFWIVNRKSFIEVSIVNLAIYIFANNYGFRVSTIGNVEFFLINDETEGTSSYIFNFSVIRCYQREINIVIKIFLNPGISIFERINSQLILLVFIFLLFQILVQKVIDQSNNMLLTVIRKFVSTMPIINSNKLSLEPIQLPKNHPILNSVIGFVLDKVCLVFLVFSVSCTEQIRIKWQIGQII